MPLWDFGEVLETLRRFQGTARRSRESHGGQTGPPEKPAQRLIISRVLPAAIMSTGRGC